MRASRVTVLKEGKVFAFCSEPRLGGKGKNDIEEGHIPKKGDTFAPS